MREPCQRVLPEWWMAAVHMPRVGNQVHADVLRQGGIGQTKRGSKALHAIGRDVGIIRATLEGVATAFISLTAQPRQ